MRKFYFSFRFRDFVDFCIGRIGSLLVVVHALFKVAHVA